MSPDLEGISKDMVLAFNVEKKSILTTKFLV